MSTTPIDRQALAQLYKDTVGYDPVADCPSLSSEEIARTLVEYAEEMHGDGASVREVCDLLDAIAETGASVPPDAYPCVTDEERGNGPKGKGVRG